MMQVLPFLNSPRDLDPSYKMDLDFWDCFGRKLNPSYNRRNKVSVLFSGQSLWGRHAMIEKCEKVIVILTKVVSI